MDQALKQQLIQQLTEIKDEFAQFCSSSKYDDASDVISKRDVSRLTTQALAAIERATGSSSIYLGRAQQTQRLDALIGIVDAAKRDIEAGYMRSLEELIHGELFSDFLHMAEHLVNSGYKDAAAVIAGSTLEAHIKQLCSKFNLSTDDNGKPKKADTLNADLAKANAYSKLDQKNVTAWLGLRNDAAHGNYGDYDKQQVTLLVSSVRDFLTRNPA